MKKTTKQTETKHIAIVIPTFETVKLETFQSVYELEVPQGYDTQLFFIKGYTAEIARNEACRIVMNGEKKFEYILWVDSDIILPPYTIQALLDCNSDLATGIYCKKIPDPAAPKVTEVYNIDCHTGGMKAMALNVIQPRSVISVSGCGFGCVLLKTSVLELMDYQLGYFFKYIKTPVSICSEDLYFCSEMTKLGLTQKCNTAVICGHVGQAIY